EFPTLLQTALTGTPVSSVPGFTAVLDQLHDRPGAETSATYHVSYDAGGQRVTDYLVETTADVPGQAVVEAKGVTVQVWRHPADPRLPGLVGACTPEVLAGWLPLVEGADPDAGHGTTEVLVYRPLRRAVLRTLRDGHTWF